MLAATYGHRVGTRLTGSTLTLSPEMVWLWTHSIEGKPDAKAPHPSMAWFVATRACGIDWDELFALFDTDAASGPLLGEAELELLVPLRTGECYAASGEIEAVERKVGRTGAFDRVVLRVDVSEAGSGTAVCTLWNTMIFPRART